MNAADEPMDLLVRRSLDQIASAAAALLGAPVVLISVCDGPHQIFVGSHGIATEHAGEPSALCRDVASASRPIVLQDARRRLPARIGNVGGFELAGYAGVPLSPDRAGAFAAITSAPRAWQSQDLDVLHALAAAAAAVLDMRAGCDELVTDERRSAAAKRARNDRVARSPTS